MAASLYTPHSRALSTLYADLESYAFGHREVFVGTAGSVVERENASGFRFYGHQFYDASGKKRERYVAGPAGSDDAERVAGELRERIAELKGLVPSLRMLAREGFAIVDPKAYATLASLHNHDVFSAGGLLVGSHAYGVLLNRLGARAAGYTTEDVDLARRESLAFEKLPGKGLLEMLRDSFHVDLLVPSRDETFPTVRVPELQAFATGLPYLGYLLGESQVAMVMAREGCCAVRVPVPERYAVHKLVISRLRTGREAKAGKDVHQACVLAAILGDNHPGALDSAVSRVPRRARRHLAYALELAVPLLEGHPRAREELTGSG